MRTVLYILLISGAFFFAVRGPLAQQEPTRIALLIGNQSYEPSVGVLKNPHNDIGLLSQTLTSQGFKVLPLVKDATRVQILAAVRGLAKRLDEAGAGAVGFLYYSGHGAAESETKQNYLIPIEAKSPGTEAFWDESVKLDDVLLLLDMANSAAKFVVFDACRNELRLPYRGSKGFEPVSEKPGIYVAYTTAPGKPASDDGETSGPYAAALASEFAKPGLDHLSLFQNVKEAVYRSTRGAQQPWAMDGLVRRIYLTSRPIAVPFDTTPENSLYALVVGVGKFRDPNVPVLRWPGKDARDFAEALSQQTRLYRKVEVKLLADEDANVSAILDGLSWLERQVSPNDVGVVFLSGHGFATPSGDYHFVPYDARFEGKAGRPLPTRSSSVPDTEISHALKQIAGNALFLVDTDHAGMATGNEIAGFANAVVLAGSKGSELAREDDKWQHGVFTKALLEGLGGAADVLPKDGVVTVDELTLYVKQRVRELTGGTQRPVDLRSKEAHNFALALVP